MLNILWLLLDSAFSAVCATFRLFCPVILETMHYSVNFDFYVFKRSMTYKLWFCYKICEKYEVNIIIGSKSPMKLHANTISKCWHREQFIDYSYFETKWPIWNFAMTTHAMVLSRQVHWRYLTWRGLKRFIIIIHYIFVKIFIYILLHALHAQIQPAVRESVLFTGAISLTNKCTISL
jgi:hypothetical protein